MGGNVLDYEAKRILNRGIDEGRLKALVDLIKDGLLSITEAAKRLDMDEAELQKYL